MIRKVIEVLPKEERWKLGLLLAAMLASGAMQTLGIAAVMPFRVVGPGIALLFSNTVTDQVELVGTRHLQVSILKPQGDRKSAKSKRRFEYLRLEPRDFSVYPARRAAADRSERVVSRSHRAMRSARSRT